jgi:hypothetical protein
MLTCTVAVAADRVGADLAALVTAIAASASAAAAVALLAGASRAGAACASAPAGAASACARLVLQSCLLLADWKLLKPSSRAPSVCTSLLRSAPDRLGAASGGCSMPHVVLALVAAKCPADPLEASVAAGMSVGRGVAAAVKGLAGVSAGVGASCWSCCVTSHCTVLSSASTRPCSCCKDACMK